MELDFMPNKDNKDKWRSLMARYRTMCYGCGKTINRTELIKNNATYKVSMHLGCYSKYLGDDHEQSQTV